MVTAVFNGSNIARVRGLWQYDYGQTLRIQGLSLPTAVEIDFSLRENGGESTTRVGTTKDGVTDVVIPDSMLENNGCAGDYCIYAFIYITDETSGETTHKIIMPVNSRPKPEAYSTPEDAQLFRDAIAEVNRSAETSNAAAISAEAWAHGHADYPERDGDNAKYYAGQARDDATQTQNDRNAVSELSEHVDTVAMQVDADKAKTEQYKSQATHSASEALLSEQASKTSEEAAKEAQTGAEAAEGQAELFANQAAEDKSAVEAAKALIMQMGQEVADNKASVEQTVSEFELEHQQAVADVNNAGQAQTERVEGAGDQAVKDINAAGTAQINAINAAGSEQKKAVEDAGQEALNNIGNGVDSSLAVSGKAADAAATGKAVDELKGDLGELIDSENVLTEDEIILGYYIQANGVVIASANFELHKYDVSDYNSVKIKSAWYGPNRCFVTNYDIDSSTIATAKFPSESSYITPSENYNVLTTHEETVDTSNYKYIYLPRYVNAGVQASAIGKVSGKVGTVESKVTKLETDVQNHNAHVDKFSKYNPTWTEGGYINVANGNLSNFTATNNLKYFYSNKQRCDSVKSIILNQNYSGAAGSAFYDANEDFIKGEALVGTFGDAITIEVPDHACYFATSYGMNPSTQEVNYPVITIDFDLESVGKGIYSQKEEYKMQKFATNLVSENPLDHIISDGGYFETFRKIAIIADSLGSGEVYYKNSDGSYSGSDKYEYSWGSYIARTCGSEVKHFAKGGMTTRSWLSEYVGDDFVNNKAQAYIIALQVNDRFPHINPSTGQSEASVPLGSSSDINLSDRTQNADTYYGNLASIIQYIKSVVPKAKIFVCTDPKKETDFNVAVRYMATIFDNVYIIDLYEYGSNLYTSASLGNLWVNGHMTSIGYKVSANHILTIMDWIIRNNMDDFLEVPYIID